MTKIYTIEEFHKVINHPYRVGEYFKDGTDILEVPEEEEEVNDLLENAEDGLFYAVNWEDKLLSTENGSRIRSVY